jgi:hypothetical protein
MGKDNSTINKATLLIFFILTLSMSLQKICAAPEKERPTLKIVDVEYGIFDDIIRSGEYVAFKNSAPEISGDPAYNAAYHNWLRDGGDWFHLDNAQLGKDKIFEIQRDEVEKNGYLIKDGVSVRLRSLNRDNIWLGLEQTWQVLVVANCWTGKGKEKDDQSASWTIKKVNGGGEITNLTDTYLLSNSPNSKDQRLQRWGVTAGTDKAIVRSPGGEFVHGEQNCRFQVYRLAPFAPQDQTKIGKFAEPQAFKTKSFGPEQLTKIVQSLVKKPTGLSLIEDGIKWQGERDAWDKLFGNPTADTSGLSHLWNRIKITYQLDRRVCTAKFFDQYDKKIQLPTQEELTIAQNDIDARTETKERLEGIGFKKAPGGLKQLASFGKNIIGLNSANGVYKWNNEKNQWDSLKINLPGIQQIAVDSNGTIFLLKQNKLYEVIKDTPQLLSQKMPNLLSFSLSGKDNLWATGNTSTLYKWDDAKKQFIAVINPNKINFISTGSDGTTMGLTQDGKIYEWVAGIDYQDPAGWSPVEGPALEQISVGSAKYIWGLDKLLKVYQWTAAEGWKEEARATGLSQIAVNNLGEIWALVYETPPEAPDNAAIFYSEKSVWSFGNTVALKNPYSNKYLSADAKGEIKLVGWQAESEESWIIKKATDEKASGPLTYNSKIALKSSKTGKYLAIAPTAATKKVAEKVTEKTDKNTITFGGTIKLKNAKLENNNMLTVKKGVTSCKATGSSFVITGPNKPLPNIPGSPVKKTDIINLQIKALKAATNLSVDDTIDFKVKFDGDVWKTDTQVRLISKKGRLVADEEGTVSLGHAGEEGLNDLWTVESYDPPSLPATKTEAEANLKLNATETKIENATIFTLINQPKPESIEEIAEDSEVSILLKFDDKYLAVPKSKDKLVISEKSDRPSGWIIEKIE